MGSPCDLCYDEKFRKYRKGIKEHNMEKDDLVKIIGDHWAAGLTGLFVEESWPNVKINIE